MERRPAPREALPAPERDLRQIARIIHMARVEVAKPFLQFETNPSLAKLLAPGREQNILTRLSTISTEYVKEQEARGAQSARRETRSSEKNGKPAGRLIYLYPLSEQEEFTRRVIGFLANPPAKFERHPPGFEDAWRTKALELLRKT